MNSAKQDSEKHSISAVFLVLSMLFLGAAAANAATVAGLGERSGSEERRSAKTDDPAAAARFHLLKRSPDGVSPIDPGLYAKALEEMEHMPQYSTATGKSLPSRAKMKASRELQSVLATWESLGPGNIGGRTRALLIHPTTPEIMYAAGVAGGVWKSIDSGATWTPKTDLMDNIAVTTLAFEPGNAEVIYAGTGEGIFESGKFGDISQLDQQRGGGIFKSMDGGDSWFQLPGTTTADFQYVNKIVVSSTFPSRVYAATNTGVFRSPTDTDPTWPKLNANASSVCTDSLGRSLDHLSWDTRFTDLVIFPIRLPDGTVRNRLIAASGVDFSMGKPSQPAQGAIWLLDDADGSGQLRPCPVYFEKHNTPIDYNNGNSTPLYPSVQGRAALAVGPNYIYAMLANNGSGIQTSLLAVVRSDRSGDPGINWSDAFRPMKDVDRVGDWLLTNLSSRAKQGWYDNVIAAAPCSSGCDDDTVWAGGVDLFRSTDSGGKWEVASYWQAILDKDINGGALSYCKMQYVHEDQHVLAFHPNYGQGNETLFIGNDGGIFRTDNAMGGKTIPYSSSFRTPLSKDDAACAAPPAAGGAVSWDNVQDSPNAGYGVTQFYSGAVSPRGDMLLGGTQDNSTIKGSLTSDFKPIPNGWERLFRPSDGGYVAFDPNDTARMYIESADPLGNRPNLLSYKNGAAEFIDAGITIGTFNMIAPFAVAPGDPTVIWLGGSCAWRGKQRTDGTGSWTWEADSTTCNSHSTTFTGVASALAISRSGERVVFGMKTGEVYLTTNGTAATPSWSQSPIQPQSTTHSLGGYVSSLAFDPNDTTESVVYATVSTFSKQHVWRSADGGASWTSLSSFEDIPALTIAVDPTNSERLYVGTDRGVRVSRNTGVSWSVESSGFANVPTEALVVNKNAANETYLYAFTHGRGAYRVRLDSTVGQHSISGTVALGGSGLSGVTVTAGSGSATTNASGAYAISGLADGSFTVTPTLAGYTFSPASRLVTIGTADVTGVDFTGTQDRYSISGTVTLGGGAGLGSVVVSAGGVTGNADPSTGAYVIPGLLTGTYTVTATLAGYTFSPASSSVTIGTSNVAGVNFTGTANTYSISGTVTIVGSGLGGVTVSTGSVSRTTDATGAYTIPGLANGTYTVTPTLAGYTFTPSSATVVVNGGNVVGVGFTAAATCTNFTITGPTSFSPTASAGHQDVAITGVPAGCTGGSWTTAGNGNWLTVSPASGAGSGPATVSWTQNLGSATRSSSVTIAGTWFSVNQAGAPNLNPTFAAGDAPYRIAFDGANVWVTNHGTSNVTKLRASDGAMLGTFGVGYAARGIAFDGASMWVANSDTNNVTKLRASDGATLGTFSVGNYPGGVAFDGVSIWVVNFSGRTVSKRRASDGLAQGTFSVGTGPENIVFDGANIWVTNSNGGSVTKLRASDGTVLGTFAAGGTPYGIAFDGVNIWVTNNSSGSVTKLASDGTILGTFPVGLFPSGVACDGANVWVASSYEGSVTKLRASDGAFLGTIAVGLSPWDVAFDGANIWVANLGENTVSKLSEPLPCTSLAIIPASVSSNESSGFQAVTLTGSPAGCTGGAWTATGNAPWLTVSPASWNFARPVTVSWSQNTSSARSATATISGVGIAEPTFTVNQAAATCTSFSISPSSVYPDASAGFQAVAITGSPAGCAGGSWTTAGNGSWLTVSPASGTGPGIATASWTQNTSNSARYGWGAIAGNSFTVIQAVPPTITLFTDGFEGTGWSFAQVSGTAGNWTLAASGTHPSVSPHGGTKLAGFNSYTSASGSQTRMYRNTGFAVASTYTTVTLKFWMYHDTGYSNRADQVQVQVSTDGTTWSNVGNAVNRYTGSTGWAQASIDLSAYKGQTVQLGFVGVSGFGNDVYLDDVTVEGQ